MFAGPNGSGKTTVKNSLGKSPSWFGLYINPDELEAAFRKSGSHPIAPLEVTFSQDELRDYFANSTLLSEKELADSSRLIRIEGDKLLFPEDQFNSYHASVLSDFLRRKAIQQRRSFSFETVMSSRDKVELMKVAVQAGYRIYLYFIATEDPAINIARVKTRVAEGGHDVPEDKIVTRYYRSLSLLREAILHADRAFLFDTSYEEPWYFAEITDAGTIRLQSDEIPAWFEPIWNSLPV